MKLVWAKRIWDEAPHNAFTDLIYFNDLFFCVFREGSNHIANHGTLRIISSADGESWTAKSFICIKGADLRDGKLSITPSKQLMLSGVKVLHEKARVHQTYAWFSDDGVTWSEPHPIGELNFWLWQIAWEGNSAYSIGYYCDSDQFIRFYQSKDGKEFTPVGKRLLDEGVPNEAALLFDQHVGYCLLRREEANGLLGIAHSPYSHWQWQDIGVPIGGPGLIRLPDGRLLAAVRLYDNQVRTSLCWINADSGKSTEALSLPSGGDTSYAGLVWHQDYLWVSYYSSHEEKTAIYLAKIELS